MASSRDNEVLIIEPFYGGSHKYLVDVLKEGLGHRFKICVVTLPASKWHWRARTGALYFSDTVPRINSFKVLFASSILNMAELLALRPDLSTAKKILYFHENQLVYPVQHIKDRDFQYGYNQIISCLAADHILFNSHYNKNSFLDSIAKFFKLQPDFRPKGLKKKIEPKCCVLYVPMKFPSVLPQVRDDSVLHIIWPHRWEHDKNPERFFKVLFDLSDTGYNFHISVLGESYQEHPPIFEEAAHRLNSKILNWGYMPSKEDYYRTLSLAHIAVSTAKHEFYGMAMLEAVYCGCLPLCPNDLVYPEIYPVFCLYNSDSQLLKSLKGFCVDPSSSRQLKERLNLNFDTFNIQTLLPEFELLLSVQ